MKTCYKCGKPTIYEMSEKPICFSCIQHIEKDSTLEGIIKQAEFVTGISFEKMKSRIRIQEIIDAKYYTMYLIREADRWTYKYIGELFNVDHSSVIYGVKTAKDLIKFNQLSFLKK